MTKIIILLILFGCQINKKDVNVVKTTNAKYVNKETSKTKPYVFKNINNKKSIFIDDDIEVQPLDKKDRLGYKVVINQDECKIVFSFEYFLQQKSKQNKKLDLQEVKLNIGFYF